MARRLLDVIVLVLEAIGKNADNVSVVLSQISRC